MSLKPSVASVSKYSIPEYIREGQGKLPLFIEYYYRWLEESGALGYLRSVVESRDIDNQDNIDRNVNGLFSILPSNLKIENKALFVKHLKSFFRSKGTEDSVKIFINALLNDNVEIEWNDQKIFRPSHAKYERTASVAIEGSGIVDIEGATLIQTNPSHAHAVVEGTSQSSIRGKIVNFLNLKERSVIGQFINGSEVKYLRNSVSRTAIEIKSYYNFVMLLNGVLGVTVINEENVTNYKGLIVRQIGNSARAVITSTGVVSKTLFNTYIQFDVTDVSGTFNTTDDIYLVNANFENNHFTKADWITGIVSSSIVDIDITDGGVGYTSGYPIKFYGGNGFAAQARVGSVKGSSIDEFIILKKGDGYEVGDPVVVSAMGAYGDGLDAYVSTIDGVGAKALPVMSLDTVITRSAGAYPVGTTALIPGGSYDNKFNRASISWDGSNWTVVDAGRYYSLPDSFDINPEKMVSDVFLWESGASSGSLVAENGDLLSQTGSVFSDTTVSLTWKFADAVLTDQGKFYSGLTITTDKGIGSGAILTPSVVNGNIEKGTIAASAGGTNYTWAYAYVVSTTGQGASVTVSINQTTKAIVSVDIVDGGHGYIAGDTIVVIGNGSGATIPALTGGQIRDGAIHSVYVNYGGNYYPDSMTLETDEDSLPATTTNAVLLPVTKDGKIISVTVVDTGEGYTSDVAILPVTSQSTATFNGNFDSTGSISSVRIDHVGEGYYDPTEVTPLEIFVSDGVGAKLLPVVDNNGTIVRVDILESGIGYTNTSSVVVSNNYSVTGFLTEALENLTQENSSRLMLTNYAGDNVPGLLTEDSYSLANDNVAYGRIKLYDGSNAVLTCTVDNVAGSIKKINVVDGGLGYMLGTKIVVFGDGEDAVVEPVVETGISNIVMTNVGVGYDETTTATIVDGKGSGAILKCNVTDGKLTSISVLNSGSGYATPNVVITCNNGAANGATAKAQMRRGLKDVKIINPGSGYSVASMLVYGDGNYASCTPLLDGKTGGVKNFSLSTSGARYTSTPEIVFTDNSGVGAVSGIEIRNPGYNYQKIPVCSVVGATVVEVADTVGFTVGETVVQGTLKAKVIDLDSTHLILKPLALGEFITGVAIANNTVSKTVTNVTVRPGQGAEVVALGKSVGAVESVEMVETGAAYDEYPFVFFPQNVIIQDNGLFKVGEQLAVKRDMYKDEYLVYNDVGERLMLEDTSLLISESTLPTPVATVLEYDRSRNMITYIPYSDQFTMISETDGVEFITENGLTIDSENSFGISESDILVGLDSGSEASIIRKLSATGVVSINGSSFSNRKHTTNSGILNTVKSKIHDNKRIQTHAYVLKTGQSIDTYEEFVKEYVHPAGYALFGDVVIDSFAELSSATAIVNRDVIVLYITAPLVFLDAVRKTTMTKKYSWLEKYKFFMDSSSSNWETYSASDPLFQSYWHMGLNEPNADTESFILWENGASTGRIDLGLSTIIGCDDIEVFKNISINDVQHNSYQDSFSFNVCAEIRKVAA